MIRKLLLLAFVVLTAYLPAVSQEIFGENFMLKRFESVISFDNLQEFSTSFVRFVDERNSRGKTKVAVRFCSTQPLKKAATKGAITLSAIYDVFRRYGFSGRDVIILRSTDCVSKTSLIWPTELWVINNEDNLPSYVEKVYSNEISASEICDSTRRFVGSNDYKKNAKTLASELVKDESTFGIVYIGYENSNISSARSFQKEIVNIFAAAGVNQTKYSVELLRWNRKLSIDPLGKTIFFPKFYLVTTKSNR